MALRSLKAIKELRFILCQSSPQSENLRYDWIYLVNTLPVTTRPSDRVPLVSQSVSARAALLSPSLRFPMVWSDLWI